jgi:hypothetical protein
MVAIWRGGWPLLLMDLGVMIVDKGIHYVGNKQSTGEKVIHKESTYIVEAINKKSTSTTAYSQSTSLWTTISNIILILLH